MKNVTILLILLFLYSCSTDTVPEDPETPGTVTPETPTTETGTMTTETGSSTTNEMILPPGKSILLLPENGNTCLTVSQTNLSAQVEFSWMTSQNTNDYVLVIENQEVSTQQQELITASTQFIATLERGYSYRWWIISRSMQSNQTARSDTFRFYVEAEEETEYIPFFADLVLPENNSTVTIPTSGNVLFSWEGHDTDNDIVNYDLRIWTAATIDNPTTYEDIVETTTTLQLTEKTTYFWLIVTNDSKGNNSISKTHTFTTN